MQSRPIPASASGAFPGGRVARMTSKKPDFDGPLDFTRRLPRPALEDWQNAARRSLRGRPLEQLTVLTHENIEINPLYTAEDLPESGPAIPSPGNGGWESCVAVDLLDPEEAIRQTSEYLARGAQSIWMKVDRRSSSWGRLTVNVLGRLLETTGGAPIYIDGRGVTPTLAALLFAAARRQGMCFDTIRGGFDFDPLGTMAADGALPWNLDFGFDLMAEMVKWTDKEAPRVRAIAVSTIPYVKAGANAVQELSLALATGVEYLRRLDAAGVSPEVTCRNMRLVLPVGRDFFMEVAKLRAARGLWARIAESCWIAPEGRSIPIHALTSPRCLTVFDPWVNLLRGTVESTAAVVGGADVLTVLPFDSAVGQPDAVARRIALNTNTILREESHLDQVADPTAGSYYVERLTHDLAADAWAAFQSIETTGGMAVYLRSGAVSRELGEVMSRKRQAISTRHDPITGISSYPQLDAESLVRKRILRDEGRMPDDISTDVYGPAKAEITSFEALIAAGEEGNTALELINMLPGDDEPERIAVVAMEREARPFEALRDISDRHLVQTGLRPRVFLSALGPSTEHRATVAFVTQAFATAGMTTVVGESTDDPAEAAAEFASSGSQSAVICATNDRAPELLPRLAAALRNRGARQVLVWGRPGKHEAKWRVAGVNGFLYPGCDLLSLLEDVLVVERAGS